MKKIFSICLIIIAIVSCTNNQTIQFLYVDKLNISDTVRITYNKINDSCYIRKNHNENYTDTLIKNGTSWYVIFNGKKQLFFSLESFNAEHANIVSKTESFCNNCIIKLKYVPKCKCLLENTVVYIYDIYEINEFNETYLNYISTVYFSPDIGILRNTDIINYSKYDIPPNAFDYHLISIDPSIDIDIAILNIDSCNCSIQIQ
jgi:hypothetical protein